MSNNKKFKAMRKSTKTSKKNTQSTVANTEPQPQQEAQQPQVQPQQENTPTPQPATEQKPQHKAPRFIDVKFDVSSLAVYTDKAQLVKFMKGEREMRIWLPMSQIDISHDKDNIHTCIIRMAAWLYYRSGLDKVAPIARWSSAKAEVANA